MRSDQRVLGVLFDMDGVLADSEAFIAEAAAAMFALTYGITVPVADFLPFVGTGEDRYLGGVAALHGVSLQLPRDKAKTYELYAQLIPGKLRPLPGSVEFVRACRHLGLKTALATSADRDKMVPTLKAIGLAESDFGATVNGLDVERKKPFPDIYLEAARRLGLRPNECLVVEDAVAGVQAALAAGCQCLALTTTFSEVSLREAGATTVVADLTAARMEDWLDGGQTTWYPS